MRLDPGERSILATFPGTLQAEEAAQRLKEEGYDAVDVTSIGQFGYEPNSHISDPLAGQAITLSGLTIFGGNEDHLGAAGPLLAASPLASGQSASDAGGGFGVLLTVVTTEESINRAVELIKEYGGQV
jgi:hypothetical protein